MSIADIKNDLTPEEIAKALDFSRPLDVHRWSDYPEADEFVERIYSQCNPGKKTSIERKHFKVVLLDLYVAWLEHPDRKIAVAMRPVEYRAKGNRYNALHISRKTIDVVNMLFDAGLIEMKGGYYAAERKEGKRTRIWPSPNLIDLFRASSLDAYKVGRAADEEVIILRDEGGNEIDYDDTPETIAMRQVVRDYNELLARTFIDIRRLDNPWIDLQNDTKLTIGRHRQHVRRIFNRSSFDKGGRFFGPWWQACPKVWRKEIFINDAPTIEQDYSSLHIALLYGRRGLNYYEEFQGDAYQLETPPFLSSPEQTRAYCKLLLLMAVNAETDKKAFAAFRSDRRDSGDTLGQSLKDHQLSVLMEGLRRKHPLIADDLGSDAGIDLMNQDGMITEYVINAFTQRGIPVLTVHDSYITKFYYAKELQQVLTEAYQLISGPGQIRSERTGVAIDDEESWEKERLSAEAIGRSEGYKTRLINWMSYSLEEEDKAGKTKGHA